MQGNTWLAEDRGSGVRSTGTTGSWIGGSSVLSSRVRCEQVDDPQVGLQGLVMSVVDRVYVATVTAATRSRVVMTWIAASPPSQGWEPPVNCEDSGGAGSRSELPKN